MKQYVTVLSNSNLDIFAENRLTKFTVLLPEPIIASEGKKLGIYLNGIFLSHDFTWQQEKRNLDYIKIKLAQIEGQIQESKYGTCLARIPITKNNLNVTYGRYYEFEHALPVIIESNKITQLSFLITDSLDGELYIGQGSPTIIRLTIGEMSEFKKQFTVSCGSLGDLEYFADNNISSFQANLPQELILDDSFAICLHSIILPGGILTIPQDMDDTAIVNFYYEDESALTLKWNIADKNFTILKIIADIQSQLEIYSKRSFASSPLHEERKLSEDYSKTEYSSVEHNQHFISYEQNSISLYTYENEFDLSRTKLRIEMNAVLHFILNGTFETKVHNFASDSFTYMEKNVNVNRVIPRTLFIYCSIVEESIVGNIKANLLDIISLTDMNISETGQKIFYPTNLNFHSLNTNKVKTIRFGVYTSSGKRIYPTKNTTDEDNNITINLLFRKMYD